MKLRLNVLYNKVTSVKSKRVGRGIGTGYGKTSGRGIKGQKSRSGVSINYFEGGQQSIVTLFPKRGMGVGYNKQNMVCITIYTLHSLYIAGKIEAGVEVNAELLYGLGVVERKYKKIKLIGGGILTASLLVKLHGISKGARSIITKSGGEVIIL